MTVQYFHWRIFRRVACVAAQGEGGGGGGGKGGRERSSLPSPLPPPPLAPLRRLLGARHLRRWL